MKKGIIGRKIGMTQIFDEIGNVIPVTVIEAGPCVVAQKKTAENDGYDAVQLGFMEVKEKHLTKAEKGHFEKVGVASKKHLKEFRLDDCSALNVGDVIAADTFAEGDKVDKVVESFHLVNDDFPNCRAHDKTLTANEMIAIYEYMKKVVEGA
mgnify:CR=1 FL=1